ncbi:hypothetical protein KBX08_32765 [Micromonospora sp. H61]|uniref:hypothetical protein n=1 Tax=Micromonospora sp. H61 TaxID=2824888 RepID=UPI001B361048|nr:hypothetical protein [Micromonospora sp. H61]MBQ0994828.1 hypothetical protein [Micromonospora sp. H61]
MAVTPITNILREYLGSESLIPDRLLELSPRDLDVSEFYRLVHGWSEVFEFPLVGVGELRPWHTRPLEDWSGKIEGEEFFTPRWDTPPLYRWPWDDTSQAAFIDAIKLHCLYFEGVAVEMPRCGWMDAKAILDLIVACGHLALLIDAGIVVVTPSIPLLLPRHSRVLLEMQQESREIMPTLGASIKMRWHGYDLWKMANDDDPRDGGPGDRLLASLYPILQDLRLSTIFPDVDPALCQQQLDLLRRIRDKVANATPFDRIDASVAFSTLTSLPVPSYQLTMPDLVAIRSYGQFETFRAGLREGLALASGLTRDDYLDPDSKALAVIREGIANAQREAKPDPATLSGRRQGVVDLTIATATGTIGTLASNPILGAATGAGAFFLTQLIQWAKSRTDKGAAAFTRHLAVFDEQRL